MVQIQRQHNDSILGFIYVQAGIQRNMEPNDSFSRLHKESVNAGLKLTHFLVIWPE
ncbi:hypothetical protein SAMN05216299_1271 [Nitrosospira sp. Nsp14]|nr:hypothetical protein SAMN05216299_1271 [Nitrosospira sp. Nsp14]